MSHRPGPFGPGEPPPGEPAQHRPPPGAARLLVLAAAALGLVIYLVGFFGEVSVTSSFGGPLLLGGGLLAATAALPRAGRVLAPAAVLTVTGTLLLVQLVVGIGGQAVLVVGLLLALLQTAAVLGALLLDTGLIVAPARRPLMGPALGSGYGGGPPAGPAGPGYGSREYGDPVYGPPGPGSASGGHGRSGPTAIEAADRTGPIGAAGYESRSPDRDEDELAGPTRVDIGRETGHSQWAHADQRGPADPGWSRSDPPGRERGVDPVVGPVPADRSEAAEPGRVDLFQPDPGRAQAAPADPGRPDAGGPPRGPAPADPPGPGDETTRFPAVDRWAAREGPDAEGRTRIVPTEDRDH